MMLAEARATAREARSIAIPASANPLSVRVILSLARIEAARILLHPLFLGGVGLCVLLLGTETIRGGGGVNMGAVGIGVALGVAAGAFLSTNAAAQRARRDRTEELFDSLPAPADSRTMSVLFAVGVGPVLVATVAAAIGWALLESNPSTARLADLALAAQLPLAVAALGALAVALGRWIPSPVTGPVVLVAHVMTPIVWAVPWIAPTSTGMRMGWHLGYLLSVILLWSTVALLRDRRTRGRIVLGSLAIAVATVGALIQIPPGGLR